MKILFITANRVGDAVLTTGLLSWLVDTYRDAEFTIACGPYGADLFRATPRLERLIVMTKKKRSGHWFDLWKACISTRWDLIVDLRNSIVSRVLFAHKRAIHGRASGSHKVIDNARLLNLDPPPSPKIWILPDADARAQQMLQSKFPILALAPAANWPPKQWPIEHFQKLVQALTGDGGILADAYVMVAADGSERAQIEPLFASIRKERLIELVGLDLQTVAACLKRARLFVGNDSGLMHLSAALGTPTVGMFGPGFPEVYGPWGKNCIAARTPETREELVAHLSSMSARAPNLMGSLTVERVTDACQLLLARTGSSGKSNE